MEEREGHIFMNNLVVANKPDIGPLLQVEQPAALCKKLAQPMLSTLDGNVYVRPDTSYAALATPLVKWVDTHSTDCSSSFASLPAFQKQVSGFEVHGQQLDGDARSVFTAPDIDRFQLLQALPASRDVAMPKAVRKLLDWSKKEAALTVGAYPAD